ncbi:Receptor-type tyrosine-protein phosphatase F-like 4 [Homarus americanus]|uniref:Receptor-type tyrosine-protein phosphatase F-like 4 n=1 Tax=Homarus americanus TaxID=6706 RepID=A0A8J5N5V9_HOMAM|nr:Receptor-type tyrosine-protein phosphatase F-like 4 [Homarus americanus]
MRFTVYKKAVGHATVLGHTLGEGLLTDEVKSECVEILTRPLTIITWHSQGITVQGATIRHSPGLFGATITRSELLLRAVTDDDGRVVSCEAHNGLGVTVTTNMTLNVFYTWWRGPQSVVGVDGDTGAEGQLHLARVHRQDAGSYSVTATNPRASLNSSFTINVLSLGNPTPNVTWMKDSNNTSEVWWGVGSARLVVERVSRQHTALYKCHASNTVSSAPSVTTALLVSQAPWLPVYPEEAIVRRWLAPVGGSTQLQCRVMAAPAPTFRWTLNNDRVLLNSHKYFVPLPQLVDGLVEWWSVLEIRKVTVRDYTYYTCTAVNTLGSLTINHTLSPPLVPHPPTHLQVTTVTASSVTISWVNNDTEILGYTIRYQATGIPGYQYAEVTWNNTNEAEVDGLTPGTQYYFTIQTYHHHGRSHFTSPAVVVTTLSVEEEEAASTSNVEDSGKGRVPRLLLLLFSLTAATLFVLTISIIVCFVRRRSIKRSASGSSNKTAALDVYTPATTPGDISHDEPEISCSLDNLTPANNQVLCLKTTASPEETRRGEHQVVMTGEATPPLTGQQDNKESPGQYPTLPIATHQVITSSPRPRTSSPFTSDKSTRTTHQHSPSPSDRHQDTEDPHRLCLPSPLTRCQDQRGTQQLPTASPLADHQVRKRAPQLIPSYTSQRVSGDLQQSHSTSPLATSPGRVCNSPLHNLTRDVSKEHILTHCDGLPSDDNISISSADSPLKRKNSVSKRGKVSGLTSNIPDVCLKSSRPYKPSSPRHHQEKLTDHVEEDRVSFSSLHSSDSWVNHPAPPRSPPSHLLPKRILKQPLSSHYTSKSPCTTLRSPTLQYSPPLCLPSKPATQVIYHGQPHIQQQLEQQQLKQQHMQQSVTQQRCSPQQPDHQHAQPLLQLGQHFSVHQLERSNSPIEKLQLQHKHKTEQQKEEDLQTPPYRHHHHTIHELSREHEQQGQQLSPPQHHHQQCHEDQQLQYQLKENSYQQHQQISHVHYHQQPYGSTATHHHQHMYDGVDDQKHHEVPHGQQLHLPDQHQQLHYLHHHHQHYSGVHEHLHSSDDKQRVYHHNKHKVQENQYIMKPSDRVPSAFVPLDYQEHRQDLQCCTSQPHVRFQEPQPHSPHTQQYDPSTCHPSQYSTYYARPLTCCDERCRQSIHENVA